ncbi:MAG: hypothetical protein FJX62_19155 [Alphaproteobacteria bacterium]|nr:hypothetical protein [Alphaproteobacteria bacterium]
MARRIPFIPALPLTLTLRIGPWRLGALAAAALVAWLAWPNYLVLRIPMAPHSGGTPFWVEWQTGRHDYYDAWSVAFVRRQTGMTEPEVHGFRTPGDAFAHFDRWLTERGWRHGGHVEFSAILPESRFLARELTRRYYRPGSYEEVLLAIWVRGDSDWLNVVLVTSRPTLIEKIRRTGERKKESEESE